MNNNSVPIILGLIFVVGAWYIFPYTISRRDRYVTSPLDMLGKRIGSVIAAAVIAFGVITNLKHSQKTASPAVSTFTEEEIYQTKSDNPEPSQNITPTVEVDQRRPVEQSPALIIDPPVVLRETTPPVYEQRSSEERIYTQDEIRKMEEASKYFGDDPIIRKRLGLPSRKTGKIDY